MSKKIKQVRMEDRLIKAIEIESVKNHGGNFTSAVIEMLEQAIMIRDIPIDIRYKMYSQGKSLTDDHRDHKKIIDGLYI